MEKIKIGKIVNAVGLKGEVKIYNYSDRLERYEELERLIIRDVDYKIEKLRYKGATVIAKLSGIEDRNQAEAMVGKGVYITEEDLKELPEDTYYLKDIIGLNIIDSESKEILGILLDVNQNGPQDLYIVEKKDGNKFMIPVVKEFVKEVNLEEGYIAVSLIEGLI